MNTSMFPNASFECLVDGQLTWCESPSVLHRQTLSVQYDKLDTEISAELDATQRFSSLFCILVSIAISLPLSYIAEAIFRNDPEGIEAADNLIAGTLLSPLALGAFGFLGLLAFFLIIQKEESNQAVYKAVWPTIIALYVVCSIVSFFKAWRSCRANRLAVTRNILEVSFITSSCLLHAPSAITTPHPDNISANLTLIQEAPLNGSPNGDDSTIGMAVTVCLAEANTYIRRLENDITVQAQEIDSERERAEERRSVLRSTNNNLRQELRDKDTEIANKNEEVHALREASVCREADHAEALRIVSEEKEAAKQEKEATEAENYSLKQQLGNLRKELGEERAAKEAAEEEKKVFRQQLDGVQRKLDETRVTKDRDARSLEGVKTELTKEKRLKEAAAGELEQVGILLKQERQAKAAVDEQLKAANTKIDGLKKKHRVEMEARGQKVAKLEITIKKHEASIELHRQQFKNKSVELNDIKAEFSRITKQRKPQLLGYVAEGTFKQQHADEADAAAAEWMGSKSTSPETAARLQNDLAERDKTIAGLRQDLETRDKTIAGLRQDLTARNDSIKELKQHVSARDTTIKQLNGSITGLRQDLAACDDAVKRLQQDVTTRDDTVKQLQQDVSAHDATVQQLRGTIAGSDKLLRGRWAILARNKALESELRSTYTRLIAMWQSSGNKAAELNSSLGRVHQVLAERNQELSDERQLHIDTKARADKLKTDLSQEVAESATLQIQLEQAEKQHEAARATLKATKAEHLRLVQNQEKGPMESPRNIITCRNFMEKGRSYQVLLYGA